MNEIANKPEYVFMTYDDVIRTHTHALVDVLLTMKSEYGKYIDYSLIENKQGKDISWLSLTRISYNLLQHLAKDNKFEYDLTLLNILDTMGNPYAKSPLLSMTNTLSVLSVHSFCKKIYIYSPTPSGWIEHDVRTVTEEGFKKIEFVSGTFIEAINQIKDPITLYVVNDISMVDEIVDTSKHQYADILLANYGYNYVLGDDKKPALRTVQMEERLKKNNYRLRLFMPFYREQIDLEK